MLNPDFIQRTKRLLQDEFEAFALALETEPPVSIRTNPQKFGAIHLKPASIKGSDWFGMMQMEKVPWCETGYYLPQRPSFMLDPLFHAGAYYVQEASSMFLEQAVLTILSNPDIAKNGITALDLCAAPGGKSTHLLTLLPDDGLLVSNEIIRSRCLILAENIAKWGHSNCFITQNDPKDFRHFPHFFDFIVADLPCSGEGLFRKNPDARKEWSDEQVNFCASRQRRIIRDVWDALKPGGYLIYSTCTFNTEENEDNVEALSDELGAEIVPIPVRPEWNISGARRDEGVKGRRDEGTKGRRDEGTKGRRDEGTKERRDEGTKGRRDEGTKGRRDEGVKDSPLPVYRFFPHRTRGEGFFMALLRKRERGTGYRVFDQKSERIKERKDDNSMSHLKNMLSKPEMFVLRNARNSAAKGSCSNAILAIPVKHDSATPTLSAHLNIISAGLTLGETKGSNFVPAASLALSTELNRQAFPAMELSNEQAIVYLKRDIIALPANAPKGFLIVTYRNIPLGFVKNTDVRANNLFPREWRIRR